MEVSASWEIARPDEEQPPALRGGSFPVDPAYDVGLLIEHEIIVLVFARPCQPQPECALVQSIRPYRLAAWKPSSACEAARTARAGKLLLRITLCREGVLKLFHAGVFSRARQFKRSL